MTMASAPSAALPRDPGRGAAVTLSPLIRYVLANNPSPFTSAGTRTHLVGGEAAGGDVAIIDPGPNDPEHIAALVAAVGGDRVTAILCTHTHRDHSPGAIPLARATGAPIIGCAPIIFSPNGASADHGFDPDYRPDHVLADGERLSGAGWTLEAVATPGHTSNHLCFALIEENALFSGDHVMGWSTTVVFPPDGDMGAYMASLDKLLARDEAIYYPAHGEPVTDPRRLVRGMAGHRRQREGQILRLLDEAPHDIPAMVSKLYPAVDPRLTRAAGGSLLAHLIELERRALVRASENVWSLSQPGATTPLSSHSEA